MTHDESMFELLLCQRGRVGGLVLLLLSIPERPSLPHWSDWEHFRAVPELPGMISYFPSSGLLFLFLPFLASLSNQTLRESHSSADWAVRM